MDRRLQLLRRIGTVALFLGLLVLFRKLLILVVFFVAFARPLDFASRAIARRTGISRKVALLALVGVLLGALGAAAAFGALRTARAVRATVAVKENVQARIEALKATELYQAVEEQLGGAENLVEKVREHGAEAMHYLAAIGHAVLFALIGFILAVVFVLEEDELLRFYRSLDPRSLAGTLLRWLDHVADAMWVTLQFQVIVAACNAVLTLPILLVVGVPHVTAFSFMVFFSGMVPVVGNFVAGAILSLLAFKARGWLGVGLFVGLTFVLHKVESYYLNPRLASRHVRLPGFVLIVSLILWEHVAGFVGLFLSFPFLFVAGRIRAEIHEEDAAASAAPGPAVAAGSSKEPGQAGGEGIAAR